MAERIRERAATYREEYRAYFEAHAEDADVAADPDPRVVLIQHLGMIAAGTTVKASRLSRDLYLRAILPRLPGRLRVARTPAPPNPDAVLQGSKIWGSAWREERAAAYGIAPDELEEHYRKRTTLGVNVYPVDIAGAVLHFVSSARSGKTTGNMLNVDGGVAAAYPR